MGLVLGLWRSNNRGVGYNDLSFDTQRSITTYLDLPASERSNGIAACSRLCNLHWRWHQREQGKALLQRVQSSLDGARWNPRPHVLLADWYAHALGHVIGYGDVQVRVEEVD